MVGKIRRWNFSSAMNDEIFFEGNGDMINKMLLFND
jgi:hypothetical protein